jgi:hypothetical protein
VTVAVSCNLSDGVVLGVDSAVTVPAVGPGGGIAKVYENAEKLFQLGNLPVGVAIYGLGAIGTRGIGSYLREFEVRDPDKVLTGGSQLVDVVESLRKFFTDAYYRTIVPAVEQVRGVPFEQVPIADRPALGLVVGGFSHGAYLSEVWEILVPHHANDHSARQVAQQGFFTVNWFAMNEPITRYIKGLDPNLLTGLVTWLSSKLNRTLTDDETTELAGLLAQYEFQVPIWAMPMDEGVAYTRFLVELVINHHRFVTGAPVVGGRVKLGKVTYRGGAFEILGP